MAASRATGTFSARHPTPSQRLPTNERAPARERLVVSTVILPEVPATVRSAHSA